MRSKKRAEYPLLEYGGEIISLREGEGGEDSLVEEEHEDGLSAPQQHDQTTNNRQASYSSNLLLTSEKAPGGAKHF